MKLYHGTVHDFRKPDLSKGRANTDFGVGFYLTESERMADDWRKGKANKHVNVYELTLKHAETCHLHIKRYEHADIDWVKFVYNNRSGKIQSNKFDIIIGPLADNGLNKWFALIDAKQATWEEIAPKIEYSKYNSLQFCFKTEKSIKLLEYAQNK